MFSGHQRSLNWGLPTGWGCLSWAGAFLCVWGGMAGEFQGLHCRSPRLLVTLLPSQGCPLPQLARCRFSNRCGKAASVFGVSPYSHAVCRPLTYGTPSPQRRDAPSCGEPPSQVKSETGRPPAESKKIRKEEGRRLQAGRGRFHKQGSLQMWLVPGARESLPRPPNLES